MGATCRGVCCGCEGGEEVECRFKTVGGGRCEGCLLRHFLYAFELSCPYVTIHGTIDDFITA